jgi:tRNA threonylcarbamoyladenosine biosynthesis protein TsaE
LEEQVTESDYLVVEWAGTDGPWPTPWIATLDLTLEGEGRQGIWETPVPPVSGIS